jgi:AcrR family transcriptional regulator
MSRNTAKARKQPTKPSKPADRRVQQTRNALGDALIVLMQEKPFAKITVQHVLDRAGVSRSTFYTHYSDKDDLFLSDVEQFLDFMAFSLSRHGDKSNRVAPVAELFAHVAEMREFHGVLIAAGKMHDFLDLAQGYFARGIEQRLGELPGADAMSEARRRAMAQMFSGGLVSLMSWWINHDMPGSPSEMDGVFHHMVQASAGIPERAIPAAKRFVVRKR